MWPHPLGLALTAGVLGWVLWEQSPLRPWESTHAFDARTQCIEALSERVRVLEAISRRSTTPLVSQVYEVAASLGTLEDHRSVVFLVCLPSGTDLRPQ